MWSIGPNRRGPIDPAVEPDKLGAPSGRPLGAAFLFLRSGWVPKSLFSGLIDKMRVRAIASRRSPMTEDTSHASLHTRPATPADLPGLVKIINAAYSIESFLEGTRTDLAHLTASLQTGTILVLEEADGNPLASVYAEVRGERGYLGILAVDPAHQGRGLARLVVEAAAEHLRRQGCRALDISVLSLRPELLPIYRRFGVVETGTEEFHYPRTFRDGARCHCIVMSKEL